MRDQVKSLVENGIGAKFINSEQTQEKNAQTIQNAINGKLKVLYIAPESKKIKEWIQATKQMNLYMIVINEALTILVWGRDSRPAFRRTINLIQLLPKHMHILATTPMTDFCN